MGGNAEIGRRGAATDRGRAYRDLYNRRTLGGRLSGGEAHSILYVYIQAIVLTKLNVVDDFGWLDALCQPKPSPSPSSA